MQIPGQPARQRTRPYQFSLRTARPPEDVLQEISERRLPGITVAERGRAYLILRPFQRHRYGGDVALLLAGAIVVAVLILTAVTPIFVALLPVAVLPAVPLLFEHRPDLAVSAIDDEEGGTRVTLHGLATSELAAALDAYLGSLPRYTPPVAAREQLAATRAAG